jgi:hypothetical protein
MVEQDGAKRLRGGTMWVQKDSLQLREYMRKQREGAAKEKLK